MGLTGNSDFRVRGYLLLNTLEYLRDINEGKGVLEQLPAEVMQVATGLAPAGWCPGEVYVEVLRKLAAAGKGNEDRSRELLIGSGSYVARTATNTFLRLLMKMLTPTLFSKKLPDFWKRDCTIGKFEVEVAASKIVCRLTGLDGFDHAACTGAGFVSYALQAMGKSIQDIKLHGWSLATPYAEGSSFELTWAD